jgi:hypothetical protein
LFCNNTFQHVSMAATTAIIREIISSQAETHACNYFII